MSYLCKLFNFRREWMKYKNIIKLRHPEIKLLAVLPTELKFSIVKDHYEPTILLFEILFCMWECCNMGTELPTKIMLGQRLVSIQMTFLNNLRKVGRLVLSRTSCYDINKGHIWRTPCRLLCTYVHRYGCSFQYVFYSRKRICLIKVYIFSLLSTIRYAFTNSEVAQRNEYIISIIRPVPVEFGVRSFGFNTTSPVLESAQPVRPVVTRGSILEGTAEVAWSLPLVLV
jgi:hypothetical protein